MRQQPESSRVASCRYSRVNNFERERKLDYKLDHKCEHLKSPSGWAAVYTLSFYKDGKYHVQRFLDADPGRVFPSEEEAKERNRELARHWLSSEDPDGRIFEEPSQ